MDKSSDFIDVVKNTILRINNIDGLNIDTNLLNFTTSAGSIGVSGTAVASYRSIGSDFYFNVAGHDRFNSPSSVLGKNYAGSVIISLS
jgi:hypothetical protein